MSAQSISLKTSDGHGLSAYEARPDKSPRGGIVLLQEIFGITGYIRHVCEGYAEHGYHVVAPALFDRVRPGIELTYSKDDAMTGRDLRANSLGENLRRSRSSQGAADRRRQYRDARLLLGRDDLLACGRPYRGRLQARSATTHADRAPYGATRCPVLMHFGDKDPIATLRHAGALRAAQGALVKFRSIRPVTASAATNLEFHAASGPYCDGPRISGRTCRVTRGATRD
jgi:carboxymethylenebutenolidase